MFTYISQRINLVESTFYSRAAWVENHFFYYYSQLGISRRSYTVITSHWIISILKSRISTLKQKNLLNYQECDSQNDYLKMFKIRYTLCSLLIKLRKSEVNKFTCFLNIASPGHLNDNNTIPDYKIYNFKI